MELFTHAPHLTSLHSGYHYLFGIFHPWLKSKIHSVQLTINRLSLTCEFKNVYILFSIQQVYKHCTWGQNIVGCARIAFQKTVHGTDHQGEVLYSPCLSHGEYNHYNSL